MSILQMNLRNIGIYVTVEDIQNFLSNYRIVTIEGDE